MLTDSTTAKSRETEHIETAVCVTKTAVSVTIAAVFVTKTAVNKLEAGGWKLEAPRHCVPNLPEPFGAYLLLSESYSKHHQGR